MKDNGDRKNYKNKDYTFSFIHKFSQMINAKTNEQYGMCILCNNLVVKMVRNSKATNQHDFCAKEGKDDKLLKTLNYRIIVICKPEEKLIYLYPHEDHIFFCQTL